MKWSDGAVLAISVACLCAASPGSGYASTLVPQTALPGDCIPKFAVPLPVFGPAGPTPRVNGRTHFALTVAMKEVDQAVLPPGRTDTCGLGVAFGKTRLWTYEISDSFSGKVLGPANWPAVTIEATRFAPNLVRYRNELPQFNPANFRIPSPPFEHGLVGGLLSIDQTIGWADPLNLDCSMNPTRLGCKTPFVGAPPTVVHLHGAEVQSAFDGNPMGWFTADGRTGPDFRSLGNPHRGEAIYAYDNSQEPGTLWFHDHALGATRTTVYSGLEGFYLVRDPRREPENLPSGRSEIEMIVQDRQFDVNSQLFFPDGSGADSAMSNLNGGPPNPDTHPLWNPEFVGDVVTVNGAPWPFVDVEPRRYHLRLLDGSNARMYNLSFGPAKVYVIGADDNFFDGPVAVEQLFLGPAERADVIVDFGGLAGQSVIVTNDAPVPFPSGLVPGADQPGMSSIMQFRVSSAPVDDTSCNPVTECRRSRPTQRLTDGAGHMERHVRIDKVRRLVLAEHEGAGGPLEVLLNNTNFDGTMAANIKRDFRNGVTEEPRIGSTELWEIVNITADAHPIHMHLAQFQILNRETLDIDGTFGSRNPSGHGYVGFDDGINPPAPGEWPLAFGSPLPPGCEAFDPLNPCPGLGPPLHYNSRLTIDLENGQKRVELVGGNPDIGPYLVGDAAPPSPEESGWKDTAKSIPGQVMRIIIRWAPTSARVGTTRAGVNLYPFDPTEGPGYVWHCHILDHEDNDMMRPYRVAR
jgi:spore coat protein A